MALGGVLDKAVVGGQSKEQHMPLHTADDAKALRGANSADILLTTTWPSEVWTRSNVPIAPENQAAIVSSDETADLCATLKPRYHFSTSPNDFFFEREPFFHPPASPESNEKAVTRFISLAPFGNSAKQKALYAFNLQVGEATTSIPAGSTASPLLARQNSRKRAGPTDAGDHYSRFANVHDHGDGRRARRPRKARSPPPGPGQCFFCLSNSNLDTHMICSIGDESYVTTAKGPLPAPDTFASSGLSFPCHQLIVPLPHEPTFRLMGAVGEKTYLEMNRFKEALQAMVAAQSKHKLGVVAWEISRQANIHLHWQFLPVPIDLLRKGLVEAGFKVEAENYKYPSFEEISLGPAMDESSDFFRLWLWSDDGDTGIRSKELVMRLDESFRFDLQFGRKVMAKLLELEGRADWRNVVQPILGETEDVRKFKEVFKPWDFTS